MEIINEMQVGVPIEEAWDLLTDIPAIAPCLPGAELTGQDGDDFEGRIKIKVGPITAEYSGTARITDLNVADRVVTLHAKGRDSRGAGNASADIVATMEADGSTTRVTIVTQLKISGKVAQFGRGVMADISKKLIGQFADCIEAKLSGSDSDMDTAASEDSAASGGEQAAAEPLELLDLAGGAIAKRLVPVAIAVGLAGIGLRLFRTFRRSSRSSVVTKDSSQAA